MKRQQKTLLLWVVVIFIMAFVMKVLEQKTTVAKRITYSQFINAIENKNITSVSFKGKDTITGKFSPGYEGGVYFESTGDTGSETFKILRSAGITPNYVKEEKQGLLSTIFINWFPMLLIIFLFYIFLRQIQSGGGKAMSFGKSKAKMLNENDKKVTFKDVSGVEEAKEELVEVVDFLKEPRKYTKLGGKIPKGVLLVGPPGTGKTLLARAVAGEAGVPFFSISGSDFVEMFVGVGASRVRDLFEQGKKHAPCIIFIDEIDAVGRHRGAGMGGGHDEREQTLNQMLVEMDGFESNEGVIIMAATNRVDVLDPALLRPGRFDRRVTVGRPDVRGRLGILRVHTTKTPMAEGIQLDTIAKGTPGFTGADLANLVNEAALLAARAGKKVLEMIDFENAKDKVLMGVERRSMVISDTEKRNTAFHEAGHTLVGLKLKHTDPIHKVTIIPRGGALGITQTLPNEDRLSLTVNKSKDLIAFMMGGRVAEEVEFGDFTNGATNDIEKATELAHAMVCDWGMSEKMGPISYGRSQSQPFMGMQQNGENPYSEQTAQLIDAEVNKFVTDGYNTAKSIISEHKHILDNLAEALILWETLDAKQVADIMEGKDIGVPTIDFPPSDQDGNKSDTQKEKVDADSIVKNFSAGEGDPSPI